MITIRLEFAASRFHATPWGRHVNEGVAEWPPSPYRLLRALYDTWQRKCSHLSEGDVEDLLKALANQEPHFALPSAIASHTRSYLSSNSEDPADKNLVFDAFLAFQPGAACFLTWPDLTLTSKQQRILEELLGNLNYLGRSESWIDARTCDKSTGEVWLCQPVGEANFSGEVVPVACAVPAGAYKGKQSWLGALTASTTDTLKSRRSAPPLLRTVRYVRPERSVQTHAITIQLPREKRVEAVILALDSTVLPLLTSTIEVAEQIRTRLMGAHRSIKGEQNVSPIFSGKDSSGHKRLDHGHLFILPQSDDGIRIHRVLLFSRKDVFSDDELRAVRGVRELWQAHNRPKVRCVATWQGTVDSLAERAPLVARRSAEVTSATPFVTARHLRRGRETEKFLADEIRRECRNHGLDEPIRIERLAHMPEPSHFEAIEFRRNRKDDPPRPGYAFRLQFANPVMTPFSLGYGCHFGLGQFRPA